MPWPTTTRLLRSTPGLQLRMPLGPVPLPQWAAQRARPAAMDRRPAPARPAPKRLRVGAARRRRPATAAAALLDATGTA